MSVKYVLINRSQSSEQLIKNIKDSCLQYNKRTNKTQRSPVIHKPFHSFTKPDMRLKLHFFSYTSVLKHTSKLDLLVKVIYYNKEHKVRGFQDDFNEDLVSFCIKC